MALSLLGRFRELVWDLHWHLCCALLWLQQRNSCGCEIFATSCSTSVCALLYDMPTIVPFIFMKVFVAIHGQLLLNLEFYGPPNLLEYVHEEKFLGTICSVVKGTITTIQPTDTTVLRTLQSVGSREHVLSGFSARTRTIIRLTRPMRLIRPQVEDF